MPVAPDRRPRDPSGRLLTRTEVDALVRDHLREERALRQPVTPVPRAVETRTTPRFRLRFAAPLLVLIALVLVGHRSQADAQDALPARPTVYADGSYAFLMTQAALPEVPIGWNPCTPVPVLVNPGGGPSDALSVVEDTIRVVNRASGLKLYAAGTSSDQRETVSPDNGSILVSFDSADHDAALATAAGIGGSWPSEAPVAGRTAYFSWGTVTINTNTNGYSRHDRMILMEHEMGHAVGLDHVQANEVMGHGARGRSIFEYDGYQHGDLTGLAKLGQIPCE